MAQVFALLAGISRSGITTVAGPTPAFTASPSPNSDARASGRRMWPNALPPATRRPRPSAPFVDDLATRCSADYRPMKPLEPPPKVLPWRLLDTIAGS